MIKKLINWSKNSVVDLVKPTPTVTVEEIHETFFTESNRLLAEAKKLSEFKPLHPGIIEKADRLKSLGFTSTKEVHLSNAERKKQADVEKENEDKQRIAVAIKYFGDKYPLYKFITYNSVRTICEKYGLVLGDVNQYIGTVPEKNIVEIENFMVRDEDLVWFGQLDKHSRGSRILGEVSYSTIVDKMKKCRDDDGDAVRYIADENGLERIPSLYSSDDEYGDLRIRKDDRGKITMISFDIENGVDSSDTHTYFPKSFSIVAPQKDFDMRYHTVSDNKLVRKPVPDPVVLQPVMYDKEEYYLIVTAWGDEASDELVVNEKMN
jgi:hypothetical protein